MHVEGATGDYHTNLNAKGDTAVEILTRIPKNESEKGLCVKRGAYKLWLMFISLVYDFCFLHIKAVDDAGHDKDIEKKVF